MSRCCRTYMRPWPSGWALTHASNCPVAPDQKVREPAAHTAALARRHRAEAARTGLGPTVRPVAWMGADEPHPACAAAYVDRGAVCSRCAPLLHPATCECQPCAYWWAHVDDER